MGIPTIPPVPMPRDPKQREALVEALRRQREREKNPFERDEPGGGWSVAAFILGLAIGGFGG